MSLLGLLLVIVIIGFILWFIETYIPMIQAFKTLIYFIAAIIIIILLFRVLGANVNLGL